MGYGAAWGRFDGNQETLQPLLGQLSWLAEQSCAHPVSYTHLDVYKRQALFLGAAFMIKVN